MVRPPLSGLRLHACRQHWFISSSFKVPLIRPIILHTQGRNRSLATSSHIMNELSFNACQGAGSFDDVVSQSAIHHDINLTASPCFRSSARKVHRSLAGECCRTLLTWCWTVSDSSDVQMIVPELPEIPHMPSRKRTFHLNHEDLETLVQPLLSCHWHVSRVKNGVNGLEVFSLNKLFSFKNFTSAVEFFDLLAGIQNEENVRS